MVNAIENLYILSGSFGNELTLNWNYPGKQQILQQMNWTGISAF
jgi:hypothetical protein